MIPTTRRKMHACWRFTIKRLEKAAEAADRIYLRPGDALVVDNYRMFHGRDPYVDPDRLLWRCWIWTTAARGVPDTELHSTPGNTAGEVCPDEAPSKRQRLEKAEGKLKISAFRAIMASGCASC